MKHNRIKCHYNRALFRGVYPPPKDEDADFPPVRSGGWSPPPKSPERIDSLAPPCCLVWHIESTFSVTRL